MDSVQCHSKVLASFSFMNGWQWLSTRGRSRTPFAVIHLSVPAIQITVPMGVLPCRMPRVIELEWMRRIRRENIMLCEVSACC